MRRGRWRRIYKRPECLMRSLDLFYDLGNGKDVTGLNTAGLYFSTTSPVAVWQMH